MNRRYAVTLRSLSAVLVLAGLLQGEHAWPDVGIPSSEGLWAPVLRVADNAGTMPNPHSDLIFRATGATRCLDCHRAGKEGAISPQVQDNQLVQDLKAKAKGIHGPGRFADCLRCHAGGNKGVEKYRR
ncbi:MAG TPA: hypothetical protein PLY42_07765 [Nitrospira sp.]|nr:hypothetical protein [Nitrospira sp.]HMU31350.1 hypothetical protein [Nitrospira sp.]HMX91246.1 hypothetical protein [Nitrospira sp.]HNA87637.1 hypothetical protein [Nitrospira sp.]HNC84721.1 hypothetical protein [Nitrospira sp.]